MTNPVPRFSSEYLDAKRQELLRLRDQLRGTAETSEAEEVDLNAESASQVAEYEDDAQRLELLDQEEDLLRRDTVRLVRVQRALEKIDEGTYGFSDASGEPIPEERLQALPDAINTVAEQSAAEASGANRAAETN